MINFELVFFIFGGIIGLILISIFIQKWHHHRYLKKVKRAREYIYHLYQYNEQLPKKPRDYFVFKTLVDIEDQLVLDDTEKTIIYDHINLEKIIRRLKRMTRSPFLFRRLKGIYYLSYIDTTETQKFLIKKLEKARNMTTIFYLIYALIDYLDDETFQLILNKIHRLNTLYLRRVSVIFGNHYADIEPYLTVESYTDDTVYNYLLSFIAKTYFIRLPNQFFEHLIEKYIIGSPQQDIEFDIRSNLLGALLLRSNAFLLDKQVLHHNDPEVRLYGFKALAKLKHESAYEELMHLADIYKEQLDEITNIVNQAYNTRQLVLSIIEYEDDNEDYSYSLTYKLLSGHIPLLMSELTYERTQSVSYWIEQLVYNGYTASIISFVNHNQDKIIEKELHEIIGPIIKENSKLRSTFELYIDEKLLRQYGYSPKKYDSKPKESTPFELSKVIWMTIILVVTLLWYPSLSLARHGMTLLNDSLLDIVKTLIIDTNYYLIVYFFIANLIYFLLLLLSVYGAHKQNVLWEIKSDTLLYEEALLPAVSIIAPAYNEEVNIVTSVQSLLNLKYPEYEVIVVNDGSKDKTLETVISHFELERSDPLYTQVLKTKSVKGIYTNPKIPNLIVIDKDNGGKADALNVGINKASHPYICGIDADSILEQEALLRLLSSTLEHKKKPVALGGNIIPANNSVIDHGHIESIRFPNTTLTRFQAIEYLRAFTSGRIGWSALNSLLIISGAFGVFKKQDIIEIGGYITSSGNLKKDSVGEDMELVVRLTHNKLRKKEDYYVSYIYHAGCHTELPDNLKTFLKQRNRWHRGLIDILSYHRQILFNPRYKQIGFFAMPYFYIFEVIGPFIETIGYISLVLSFVFGFVAKEIVIFYFLLTILIGIVVSLMSLLVSEKVTPRTSKKDVAILIVFAILENFGYRQLISFHRAYSFFTAYFERGTWGEQKRRGLSQSSK